MGRIPLKGVARHIGVHCDGEAGGKKNFDSWESKVGWRSRNFWGLQEIIAITKIFFLLPYFHLLFLSVLSYHDYLPTLPRRSLAYTQSFCYPFLFFSLTYFLPFCCAVQ